MGKRMKFKISNGDNTERKNQKTVKLALQEMGEKQTGINISSGYGACIGALGKYRKWTIKEVVEYLNNHWHGNAGDFLEDLEMQRKFRR